MRVGQSNCTVAALFVSFLLAFIAAPLRAQTVALTPRGSIVVAHDGVVDLFDGSGRNRIWRAEGVPQAGAIVTSEKQIAVLQPMVNRAAIIDIESGRKSSVDTGETPIDGVFADGNLYIVDRDSRSLERVAPGGARTSLPLAADPAFLRVSNGKLYVYSRTAGDLQEITLAPFAVSRSTAIAPFASALQVDRRTAYLVYPSGSQLRYEGNQVKGRSPRLTASGVIRTVNLQSMQPASEAPVGAAPLDLAMAAGPTALTARLLAVADPSSNRVWIVEGEQSVTKAFARGFLRGLIGFGAFGDSSVRFDSGVDRLSLNGDSWVAYDSSSGTLYRFSKRKSDVLARGVAPHAFAAIPGGVAWWQNGTLVAEKENR